MYTLPYLIYLFLAVLGLRCCTRAFSSCSAWASHCGGVSFCGAQALGARASIVATGSRAHSCSTGLISCGLRVREPAGFSSCGLWTLEHGLSSCRTQVQGMWDLPGPGIEPMSSALVGRFLPTAPPGKTPVRRFFILFLSFQVNDNLPSFSRLLGRIHKVPSGTLHLTVNIIHLPVVFWWV